MNPRWWEQPHRVRLTNRTADDGTSLCECGQPADHSLHIRYNEVMAQAEKHLLHEAARDEVARLDETLGELRKTVLDLCVTNEKLRQAVKIAAAELSSGIQSMQMDNKGASMLKARATLLAVIDHLH